MGCLLHTRRDFGLNASQSVVRQLKLQMLAERNRRAAFIVAEGQKSAMRKESEGVRVEKYKWVLQNRKPHGGYQRASFCQG